MVEDVTEWASDHPNRTDDLHLILQIRTAGDDAIEQVREDGKYKKYLQDGLLRIERNGQIYNAEGKRIY